MYLYLLPAITLFIIFFYLNFQTIIHIFNNVLFKCRNNYLVTQNKNCIDKCYNKFNFLKIIFILAYNTFKILLIQRLNKLTITPISKIYTLLNLSLVVKFINYIQNIQNLHQIFYKLLMNLIKILQLN